MQSKGAIKLVAVLLALACVWQLSFTLVTSIQENKAAKYAQNAVEVYKQSAEFAEIPEVDKAYVLDSIAKKENRWYIDSISSEKVYFRYTYKDVKSKEINLGLDLKGGMNVMLQVQLEDLVKALAGENRTPEFEKAISLAKERSVKSPDDFITLFAQAWKEVSNGQRLHRCSVHTTSPNSSTRSLPTRRFFLSSERMLRALSPTHSMSSVTVSTVSVLHSLLSRDLETVVVFLLSFLA